MTNPVTPYLLPLFAGLVIVGLLLIAAHKWDVGDWPRRTAGADATRMGGTWIKVSVFTVALVGAFVRSGDVVTAASGGGGGRGALPSGVGVAAGEQIFWGAGKCSTCHSVGARGGKIRGPNLGVSSAGAASAALVEAKPGEPAASGTRTAGVDRLPIGIRAAQVAAERAAALGRSMSGTEYLVESIANPSAYLAHGYKDEMPKVYLPPVSLTADQITSVILYLQSLGGTPDPSAIHLPPEIMQAAGTHASAEVWKPYLPGDSVRGHEIFFDLHGPAACAKCHRVGDRGGNVGPELSSVGASRTPQFLVESLLEPRKEITDGYETTQLRLGDGRTLEGVVRRETPDSLWLGDSEGNQVAVPLGRIAHRAKLDVSLMSGDFAKKISVQDFHDLLTFLESLQPYRVGDTARGRALFFDLSGRAACAKCHRLGSRGGDVGPELTEVIAIRTSQGILESILEPSKRIASGYAAVQIQTSTGRSVSGVIIRETADSVWLGTADGGHVALPTRGILQRNRLSTSLMPDSVGKGLSAKDLGDLMAFLESLR